MQREYRALIKNIQGIGLSICAPYGPHIRISSSFPMYCASQNLSNAFKFYESASSEVHDHIFL